LAKESLLYVEDNFYQVKNYKEPIDREISTL